MILDPEFSIVVPTRDRPEALRRCLDALSALEPGLSFEVIVADDGGQSEAADAIRIYEGRLPLVVLRLPAAGPAAARNAALRAARGRWIAFTDDDCLPSPQWLAQLSSAAGRWPGRGVGGRTVSADGANAYSIAHQMLVDYVTRRWRDESGPHFFPSNNVAFPSEALRELGAFDASFPFAAGEDRDLCDRWISAGYRMVEAPDAVVQHAHELSLGDFCRMHYRYGRGARRCRRRWAERHRTTVHLERATFYAQLIAEPFRSADGGRASLLSAILILSQCCHVAGYVHETWSERLSSVSPVPASAQTPVPGGGGGPGTRPSAGTVPRASAQGE